MSSLLLETANLRKQLKERKKMPKKLLALAFGEQLMWYKTNQIDVLTRMKNKKLKKMRPP